MNPFRSILLLLALLASACHAPAQQALKVDPDTGQLVEPTTLLIGANQTFTVASNATLTIPSASLPIAAIANLQSALDARQPLSANLTTFAAYTPSSLPISNATQSALDAKLSFSTANSTYVGLSGNQSVAGLKTFTSNLNIVPPTSTEINSSAFVWKAGGLNVPSSGYISGRGGKQWGVQIGGGVFTASTGSYAGQSEIDATTTWGYNLTSGSPNDDVQWGQGFESRYVNDFSDISSEWYLFWKSPLHGAGNNLYLDRRPIQVNVANHDTGIAGAAFKVDWTISAETWNMLGSSNRTATTSGGTMNNDRFFRVLLDSNHLVSTSASLLVSGNGTFNGSLTTSGNATNVFGAGLDLGGATALRVGTGTSAPLRLEQTVGGQQGLSLYSSSLSRFTRYHTGLDGGTETYLDFIGQSGTPTSWLVRQSSNNGTTMTERLRLSTLGNFSIGTGSDDTVNRLQVAGSISAVSANSTSTGLTTNGIITVGSGATALRFDGGSIGGNAGIWAGSNVSSPSASNYSFLAAANTTFLGTTSGGTVGLRTGNSNRITATATTATFDSGVVTTFQNTTASTSTTTGAVVISGGVGVAGRISTTTLSIGGTNATTSDLLASASATLDFPSIAANGGTQDLTITVTGAVTGDTVVLGLPSAPSAGVIFQAYVSSANTVTVRATNATASPIDPASASYRVAVLSF